MSVIYVLEDDNSIRELVVYTLNHSGHDAQGFGLPSQFWAQMAKAAPDLLLLDIMLPEQDGIEILKQLRAEPATRQLPVIMLTAKGSEYDRVLGLDSGADDYIPKPFGMMELVARVNALLRRAAGNASLVRGNLSLDEDTMTATLRGVRLELNNKEFNLLKYLMQKEGKALTRENILNAVWGYDEGETRTVDNHVARLRKLGIDYIETVFGVGYKFVYKE